MDYGVDVPAASLAVGRNSIENSGVEVGVVFPAVSADYIIDLYHRYLRDPTSVDASWRPYFDDLWGKAAPQQTAGGSLNTVAARLIDAYRQFGHRAANLDPLGLWHPPSPAELESVSHDVDEASLDVPIHVTTLPGTPPQTLRELIVRLKTIYTGSVGFDCAHVDDPTARAWLYAAAEQETAPEPAVRREAALRIIEASEFERFFNRRFLGKKRFGAEGAEAMLAWFDAVLARSAGHGVCDVVIGGTARGRLNVMANIIKKPLTALLHEFKGRRAFPDEVNVSSDVPYHFGFTNERTFGDAAVRISYCNNPSHLEAINAVALGRVRARQDSMQTPDEGMRSVLGLLVHTDAAFAGQGVVAEVLQLSGLPAYHTGGTIHLVINNQVGFTTDPKHGRTSIYCTDVARTIGAPVLHVNGDDVDAVVRCALISADYRARFQADIIVDFVCYRRSGHNEIDEPSFTQPLMYRKIAAHPPVQELYISRAIREGVLSQDEAEAHARQYFADLDAAYAAMDSYRPNLIEALDADVAAMPRVGGAGRAPRETDTGVALDDLRRIGLTLSQPPEGVTANPKIVRQLNERGDAFRTGKGISWAFAEALAIATLACEGVDVRFSGQDSPRGAFSQRHFVLVDQETGATIEPFNRLQPDQGRCQIIASPLSEYSVLGFEYGYAMDAPGRLVVWEAQFGDFANVAQVVIDQFIVSGEDKWLDASGVTLLLPHGLEGQGPDHSSARIERFLQLCAGGNMTVANCSTPANLFHLLRHQAYARPRKPLVVFTTKSLLRHRYAVSRLEEFGRGTGFRPVIGADAPARSARRVLLCSGKLYYDVLAHLAETPAPGVAIVRLEQLYPFPAEALRTELARFPGAEVIWCQEEPRNMGAWSYVDRRIEEVLRALGNACPWPACISRPDCASTAIGITDEHNAGQAELIRRALGRSEMQTETKTLAAS